MKVEAINCNLCQSNNCKTIGTFEFCGQELKLVKCLECGLNYVNPRVTQEELNKYFQDFHRVSQSEVEYWNNNKMLIIKQVINILKKYKPGKLLDVGSAYGFLLNEAKQLGWKPYGVEISKANVEYSKEKYNIDIFNGYLKEAKYKEESFDVVTIIDVLYYSYDPIFELKETRRILKDGGLLIIRDTNRINYIQKSQMLKKSKDLFENFFFFGMKDHLYFFNINSCKKMLVKAGFKDITFVNSMMGCETKKRFSKNKMVRLIMLLFFDAIWFLSCKKICLAPSVIVMARK